MATSPLGRIESDGSAARMRLPLSLTWLLALTSMLAFLALPALLQELYASSPDHVASPPGHNVVQIRPGDFQRGVAWLWAVSGIFLACALVIPRRWHAARLAQLKLPVDEAMPLSAVTYRIAPQHHAVAGTAAVARLRAGYWGRLGITLLLLWPVLLGAGDFARSPVRWFATVGGSGEVYAGPQDYLPVFIAAIIVLLLEAPTMHNVLGCRVRQFQDGRIRFGAMPAGDVAAQLDVAADKRRRSPAARAPSGACS